MFKLAIESLFETFWGEGGDGGAVVKDGGLSISEWESSNSLLILRAKGDDARAALGTAGASC
jgi:hypothetical protein